MNILRDLFGDLVDVVVRNVSLPPDDVLRLQEIEASFRKLGNKLAESVKKEAEQALDNIREAFATTFESVDKRLQELEEKIDALSSTKKETK